LPCNKYHILEPLFDCKESFCGFCGGWSELLFKSGGELRKEITQVNTNLRDLSSNIHREKNQESALNQSIAALNKTLEYIQDKILPQ